MGNDLRVVHGQTKPITGFHSTKSPPRFGSNWPRRGDSSPAEFAARRHHIWAACVRWVNVFNYVAQDATADWLSLVTNNSRFLILPERSVPNIGSRVLSLTLGRLSGDWQNR